jgi:dTDP-4-dehydrorhamnose 3,5-epimerase
MPKNQEYIGASNKMRFAETFLKGAYIIESESSKDNRGIFSRLFCKTEFKKIGFNKEIVQINHSLTNKKGSIRGMHYQIQPYSEIKMIKCIKGKVFDVIVDIRKDSSTFLKWHAEIISENDGKMMYVPEGFAHGFQTLEDYSELVYFHTNYYNKNCERRISFKDPLINIKWPLKISEISEKDSDIRLLNEEFRGISP